MIASVTASYMYPPNIAPPIDPKEEANGPNGEVASPPAVPANVCTTLDPSPSAFPVDGFTGVTDLSSGVFSVRAFGAGIVGLVVDAGVTGLPACLLTRSSLLLFENFFLSSGSVISFPSKPVNLFFHVPSGFFCSHNGLDFSISASYSSSKSLFLSLGLSSTKFCLTVSIFLPSLRLMILPFIPVTSF